MTISMSRLALGAVLAAASLSLYAQQQPPAPQPGAAPPPADLDPIAAAERARRDENSVSIYALLEQVAENERVEFIVDPRVRARVLTVPTFEEPDLELLMSVLRVHGYMTAEIEGRIHIVPDANARQMPTRLLQRDDPSVSDHEVVTRVLTLNNGSAAELIPVLRPMMPVYAQLAAASAPNKIVIVDRYDNVRRITELINELTD